MPAFLVLTLEPSSCRQTSSVAFAEEVTSPAKIKVVLNLDSGHKLLAWPKSDGGFVLHGVPEGAHLLDVYAIGLVYPQARLPCRPSQELHRGHTALQTTP